MNTVDPGAEPVADAVVDPGAGPIVRVAYALPGETDVVVRADLPYVSASDAANSFDLYVPPGDSTGKHPLLLVVFGIPDAAMERVIGRRLKNTSYLQSWGRLLAAAGMLAVVPGSAAPEDDMPALLAHLREHADVLGIDRQRIGLLAWSGHGPMALALLRASVGAEPLRCLGLLNPYTLDRPGETRLAETVRSYGMTYPIGGMAASELPADVPLFVVRAGQDVFPFINEAIDALVADALQLNLPLTLLNLPHAAHSFDMSVGDPQAAAAIAALLDFLGLHLQANVHQRAR